MNITEYMADFFAMGGYASYVWWSFGLTFVVIVGNIIAAKRFRRRVLEEVSQLKQQSAKKVSQPSLHNNLENTSGGST